MPEIVDQIGLQIVVDDQTAGKIQVINTQLKTLGSSAEDAGKKSAGGSEKAKESFRLWGEKTSQLQYLLVSMGGEVGKVASQAVRMTSALDVIRSAASPLGLAIIGVTTAVGLMYKAFSDSPELNRSKEALKSLDEYAKGLDQTIQSMFDNLNKMGPGAVALREINKKIEEAKLEKARLSTREESLIDEGALSGSRGTLKKAQELLGVREDLEKVNSTIRDLNAKRWKLEVVAAEERDAARDEDIKRQKEKNKREMEELKRKIEEERRLEEKRIANMNAFRKWQKDQASEKLGMEYDVNVKATESWMKEQSPQQREEEIARGHFAVLADIERDYYKQKEEWRKEDLQAQREYERARRESVRQWIDVSQAGMDATMQVAGMFDLFGEKSAKSEEERAKAVGMRLGFENIIMAATETAKAVASFEVPPVAIMHGIAAALHTAAAIKCFADPKSAGGFSASSPGGGGYGASAQSGAQWTRDAIESSKKKDASNGIVINIYGNQINADGADKLFAEGVERWRKQQNPGSKSGRL